MPRGWPSRVSIARSRRTSRDRSATIDAPRRRSGRREVLVEWCLLERQLAMTASDATGGRRWLDAAVAFGPGVELDPLRHPDDERDLFARRRTALREEVPATLSIATTPAAAEVWIDGVRRCESPCTVTLLPADTWRGRLRPRTRLRSSTSSSAPARPPRDESD